jgi:hypothetical protein
MTVRDPNPFAPANRPQPPRTRREAFEQAAYAVVRPILDRREQFEAIEANNPGARHGDQRVAGETPEEYSARQAAMRGNLKAAYHARFEKEVKAALRQLDVKHRRLVAEATADVQREREAVRNTHDPQAVRAERERVQAKLSGPSGSLTSDLGARLTDEYRRAKAAGDDLTVAALMDEFGETVDKAAADPDNRSTDHQALRELHHRFREEREAREARLQEREAERDDLMAQGPRIVKLVRDAEVEAGIAPVYPFENGPWAQSILGLPQFPEDAITMPAEPEAPSPAPPELSIERDDDRMARIYGGSGVASDEGHVVVPEAEPTSNGDGADD